MFEERGFESSGPGNMPGREHCEWRFYLALLGDMNRLDWEHQADLAMLSDAEVGNYNWKVYWGRVADTDAN